MIGKITGVLVEIDRNEGMIETQSGVSYRIYLPTDILYYTPPVDVSVYTHLQVKDDDLVLFGFTTREEYLMFKMLLGVDGVGPKTAHMVLSKKSVSEITRAVQQKDLETFTAIPGLGKKSAQKILLELSAKLKSDLDIGILIEEHVNDDALAALTTLGYRLSDAKSMLKGVDPALPVEEQVTRALQKR